MISEILVKKAPVGGRDQVSGTLLWLSSGATLR